MTLLIILVSVFAVVTLIVILGERFSKPMSNAQQTKFSKITVVLVFILLVSAFIKEVL